LCGGSALLVSCNLSAAPVASQASAISIWKGKSERERHWRGKFGWRCSRQAKTREPWSGSSDLFDPCTPRFEMRLSLEPWKV
jgi:hypothetical protein